MNVFKHCACVFTVSAISFSGQSQNNRLVETELTHEKKVIPIEYKTGAESSARCNGANNMWELTLEEVYNAEDLEGFSQNNSFTDNNEQLLFENENIKLLSPLDIYEKIGSRQAVVGSGSIKLHGTIFNNTVKTQQIITDNIVDNTSLFTYTVYNNWYSADDKQTAILSIVEKYATIRSLNISMSEKKVFLNKSLKTDLVKHSITKAYPVPTESEINFEIFLKSRSEKVELKFINTSGNEVLVKKIGSQEEGFKEYKLQLSELTSGNYISELVVNGVVYDRKKISVIR